MEIKHVLTSTFGLQTTSLEQCVPLSVGDVPTMNKEDLSCSVWVYQGRRQQPKSGEA